VSWPPQAFELGLGLLSIGRNWGVWGSTPPGEEESLQLLDVALRLGIRVFDTAPAYAESEKRLGHFLSALAAPSRAELVVMTKAGEHWDAERGTSFVDHSRDALIRSIDRSLELLGQIDLLQIHKATRDVVRRADVEAAIVYARSCGVSGFGASVSDVEAGAAALATGLYDALQFPLNLSNAAMLPILPGLAEAGAVAIVNRPFAMGALVVREGDGGDAGRAAFRFLREKIGSGVVLTGTGKPEHLRANAAAFHSSAGAGGRAGVL
jgi:aryl-alcohol dehydrogenase-like predicted oxidoreductase